MTLALVLLIAAVTMLLTGPADAALTRHRLARRATALRLPPAVAPASSRRSAAPNSAATPLLRTAASATDAWAARHLPGASRLQHRLAQAGSRFPLATVLAAALLLAFAIMLIALSLQMSLPAAILIAAGLAAAITHLVTGAAIRRRRAAFTRGFPDCVALIIRSLRAGLTIAAATAEAGRAGAGPAARVFATVAEEMRLGQPLEAALWAAAAQVRLPDFDFLVVTIALQGKTGGNLAETLAGLDETLRMRRQLALKVRAMAAEARASALIIGSLPFAMAALLAATSPEYLLPLFTTTMGRAFVAAGMLSLGIGAVIINQLMQVEA